jgi:hypothetical protein
MHITEVSFITEKSWLRSRRIMFFNATFNNISVISWRSVLLVDETRAPREKH